jgi:hypothetical protein
MEGLTTAISMFGYTFIFCVVALVLYENLKRRSK